MTISESLKAIKESRLFDLWDGAYEVPPELVGFAECAIYPFCKDMDKADLFIEAIAVLDILSENKRKD